MTDQEIDQLIDIAEHAGLDASNSMSVIHELLALRAHVAKLEAVLKALVERLDEVSVHPEFISVWTLHHVHGGRYNGPNWVEPLEMARATLNR